jgi:lipoprotein-anchoring transpeptidase ErfK/SrfK
MWPVDLVLPRSPGRTMAIGFHDVPRDPRGRALQTEAQLGAYRSLGCIRQSTADAQHLYAWAPVGTTVVVVR